MNFEIEEEKVKAEIIKSVRADSKLSKVSLKDTSVFMIIVSAMTRVIIFILNPILKEIYESIFIKTSNKYNLQKRLLEEGLGGFKKSEKAKTTIKIGSQTRPTSAITIPQGLIIKTSGDDPIEFELLEAGSIDANTLPDSNTHYTMSIPARAIIEGSSYNVREDSLTVLDEPIEGIDIVTNPEPATGGREEETIEAVKERLLTKKTGQVIGLTDWFKSEAEKIDGVLRAKVVRQYRGLATIGILITSPGGIASSTLVQTVQNYFDAEERNPAGAWHVIVAVPVVVRQNFIINVFYDRSASIPEKAEVKKIIREYVSKLTIGGDLILSALSSSLILSLGLRDVSIISPTTNVSVLANQLLTEGDITVTVSEFEDV